MKLIPYTNKTQIERLRFANHEHVCNRPISFSLNRPETKAGVQIFKRQELQGCLWSKTRPYWDETTPQGRDTVVLDGLDGAIDKSVVNLLVGWLTHEIGTDSIKRRHGARHEKSGNKTGAKGGSNVLSFPSSEFGDVSLGQIVDSHFCGIQDAGSQNVGFDSAVKPGNSLVSVHVRDHGRQRDTGIFVGLGKGLQNVKGVANHTTNTTRNGTGQKFHVEGSIGASTKVISHRSVSTKLDARVKNFSAPGKSQSLPERSHTFVRVQGGSRLADSESGHLHAGLDRFDRMGEVDGEARRATAEGHGLEKVWFVCSHRHFLYC
mmetsp:Transcript_868/g.2017  ORF Transcript_868/g.2017 Transcript_868/m.2017 type:complete len:320 (-) Transcript_868:234-1193(-)